MKLNGNKQLYHEKLNSQSVKTEKYIENVLICFRYDQPLDMTSPGPNDDDQYHSPPQTYPGCFGLPYQVG